MELAGISLIAKTPRPPLGDGRISKYSFEKYFEVEEDWVLPPMIDARQASRSGCRELTSGFDAHLTSPWYCDV